MEPPGSELLLRYLIAVQIYAAIEGIKGAAMI
jgi:hypothetical protein